MGKQRVNLTCDADLLNEAKSMGINLSEMLEGSVREAVRLARARQWRDGNRQAIDGYDARVAAAGTMAERLRNW